MNRRRILSGAYGLIVVILAIWLDAHGRKLQSQILILTAFALAGPVGVAAVTKGFQQLSFRVALPSCAVIHGLFLWKIAGKLPFQTLGVAILVGSAEALVLVILSAKITEMFTGAKAAGCE
jgi:hypothetical protein